MNDVLFFENAEDFDGFSEKSGGDIKYRRCEVDKGLSKKLNIPKGLYFSASGRLSSVIAACAEELKSLTRERKRVLTVGIGNPYMACDALGADTVRRVKTGARVKSFIPFLEALTGIGSYEAILGAISVTNPDCVIVVDALAAKRYERIGNVYQITDAGLSAGSGLGREGQVLNESTLGVYTIAIGVPTVVSALRLIEGVGAIEYSERLRLSRLIVTPKDIDYVKDRCANSLSKIINRALKS